jgi:hypothetical protein
MSGWRQQTSRIRSGSNRGTLGPPATQSRACLPQGATDRLTRRGPQVVLLAAVVATLVLALVPAGASGELWRPPLNSRWQYQLEGNPNFPATGGINVGICARPYTWQQGCARPRVFDIDLYVDSEVSGNNRTLNTAAVNAIHARGARAICYVDAGSIENFRPDYPQYVEWNRTHGYSLIGKPFDARFPDEFWLNINNGRGQRTFLLRMIDARVAKCVQAGFDGVEFDNVDAYAQGQAVTGWNISYQTQLVFNRALADIAHRHGLSAGLKNDLEQIPDLMPSFEYAINESCFRYGECGSLRRFISVGKPVFQVQYGGSLDRFCPTANRYGFNSIQKAADLSLRDLPYTPCR